MFRFITIHMIALLLCVTTFGQTYIKGPSLIEGITETVTASGTTTLTKDSQTNQRFTGTSNQTVVLPDATTIPLGRYFQLENRSTGTLTVQSSGGGALTTIAAGTQKQVMVVSVGTAAGTWDVSAWSLADVLGVLPVANGGTGLSTTPTNGQVLIGNGTGYSLSTLTATANQTTVTNGAGSITIGTVQNIGTASSPTFSGLTLSSLGLGVVHSSSGGVLSSSLVSLTSDVTGTLPIGNGGTGLATTPTNGQLLIGNGTNYSLANLTGTANRVTVTNGSGTITLSGPQDIATSSSPTFSGLTLSSLSTGIVHSNGSGVLSSSAVNLASEVTGVLPSANGGTNNGSLAVTAGGVLYTDGSKVMNVGAGTSGYALTSNGASAPSWTSVITNPMTTTGDVIYGGASGVPTRLAAGTSGYILQTLGNTLAPIWTALSSIAGSITSNGSSTFRSDYIIQSTACTSSPCTPNKNPGLLVASTYVRNSAGVYTITFNPAFSDVADCSCNTITNPNRYCNFVSLSASAVQVQMGSLSTGTASDEAFRLSCRGPR